MRDCQFLLFLRHFDYNAFGCLLEAAYIWYDMIYDMIYLLTAIGLTPGGSSTVHIYTQTIHRPT